jgi:hypothetical protein
MTTLKMKSKGPAVTELTKKLVSIGLLDNPTSEYDTDVRAAVKIFQSRMIDSRGRPLTVDGIAGPLTMWALNQTDCTELFDRMAKENKFHSVPETGGTHIGRAALAVAISEMLKGAGEEEANNAGPFVAKYHRISEKNALDKKYAWCAAFVSFCFKKGADKEGLRMPFAYTGGAQNILNQAKAKKLHVYSIDDEIPQPGDVAVWKRGSQAWQGHVGIVHHVENGIMYVIEGNRGPFPSRVAVFDYVMGNMTTLLGMVRFE